MAVEELKYVELETLIYRAVNKVILQAEELYGKGQISRNQADRRIRNARSVGKFLLERRVKKGGEN